MVGAQDYPGAKSLRHGIELWLVFQNRRCVFQNKGVFWKFLRCKRPTGATKSHSVYHREGGLSSPLLVVMVVTNGSPKVVGTSPWGLPHFCIFGSQLGGRAPKGVELSPDVR